MAKKPKVPVPPRAARTPAILDKLETQHPDADTALHYRTPFELLVATILSAQTTDVGVNMVTPALFERYPDARALAAARTPELERLIQSTGFFRAKSRSLLGMASALVERHGGEVPARMEDLVALPGVGRKTANVVLGHALGVPGLPVDRHVLRVANRIGIARSDDPGVVETQLTSALAPERWTRASDTLILHGRRICKPKPLCDQCAVGDECDYFKKFVSRPGRRKNAERGTRAPAERHERGAGGPASKNAERGARAPAKRYERGAGGPASKNAERGTRAPAKRYERGAGGPASKK